MTKTSFRGVGAVSILFISLCIAAAFLFISRSTTEAASPFQVTGYAWSETIGWIQFNGATHNVQIDASKNMSGFAWSENIGWVQFGGLTGCPAGTCNARVITDPGGGSGYELAGWARALAYNDPQAGGWDGWISLNCINNNSCGTSDYAIRISSNGTVDSTNSFGWGDMVVGWTDFGSYMQIGGLCPGGSTYKCLNTTTSEETKADIWCGSSTITTTDCSLAGEICGTSGQCEPVTAPTVVTFTVQPLVIRKGGSVTVTWDVIGATSCTITSNGTAVSTGPVQGTVPVNNIQSSQTTIALTCDSTLLDSKLVRTTAIIYE